MDGNESHPTTNPQKYKTMAEIKTFAKTALRNGAHYSVMEAFLAMLKSYQFHQYEDARLADAYAEMVECLQEENRLFRISLASEHTEEIFNADFLRDQKFLGIKNMLKAMSTGTSEQQAAAKKVSAIVKKYSVETDTPYDQESGILTNLIGELEENASIVATAGITQHLADMKAANEEVKRLLLVRNKQLSELADGKLKAARAATDGKYDYIIKFINCGIFLDGVEVFDKFGTEWNKYIDRIKAQDYSGGAKAEAEPTEEKPTEPTE